MAETMERAFAMGIFTVKDGKENAFLARWKEFAYWTLSQYKNMGKGAQLLQDIDNPRRYIVVGEWNNFDTIKQWRNRLEFKEWMKRMSELCDRVEPLTLKLAIDMTLRPDGIREEEDIKTKAN